MCGKIVTFGLFLSHKVRRAERECNSRVSTPGNIWSRSPPAQQVQNRRLHSSARVWKPAFYKASLQPVPQLRISGSKMKAKNVWQNMALGLFLSHKVRRAERNVTAGFPHPATSGAKAHLELVFSFQNLSSFEFQIIFDPAPEECEPKHEPRSRSLPAN